MSRGTESSPVSGTAVSPRASPPVTLGSRHRSPNRSPRNERSEASCASPAPSVGSAGSRDAPTDQRPPHHLFSPFDHSAPFKKEEERRLSHLHYLHQPYFSHRPLLAATAYPVCKVPKDVARHSH
ncbi:hypothetical protein ABMA27_004790 [Loxostege sticticalis]|uniref:Uncharacterized protein n=1 Tax=Loxostege sticticalis TaxID=481309 RepID=A0ABR3HKQ5_LOXSC